MKQSDLLSLPFDRIFLLVGSEAQKTIIKSLSPDLFRRYGGNFRILIDGVDGERIGLLSDRKATADIGYVTQNPDAQIVTDKVWHELAHGLECLGTDDAEIRRRVAEISSFFGITPWFHRDTCSLSGGQKE